MEKEKKSELSQHVDAIESSNHQLPVAIENDNGIAQKSAYITMAEEYEKTKDFPQAMQCYEDWLKIASTDDEQQKGNVYWRLGHVYQEMEENHKALMCFEKALEIAQHLSDQTLEVKLYINLEHFHFTQGNFQQSCDYYKKELELAITLDDIKSEEVANYKLGLWCEHLGDYAIAIQYQEKLLRMAVDMAEEKAEATAYRNLGGAYQNLEDHYKAIYCYEKAYTIVEELADKKNQFYCSLMLGIQHLSLGHHEDTIKSFKTSLATAMEINNTMYKQIVHIKMADAYMKMKDFPSQVIHYYEEWLKIASPDDEERGNVFLCLGNSYQELKNPKQAITCYKQSLEIAKQLSDQELEAKACGNLGCSYFTQENFQMAIDYYGKELELRIKLDDRILEGKAHEKLGRSYEQSGDSDKAIEFYQNALTVAVAADDKEGVATTCENLGNVYQNKGNYNEAEKFHQRQLQVYINIPSKDGQARAYRRLGINYKKLGKFNQAIKNESEELKLRVENGDKKGEAEAHYNLGISYKLVGEYQQALTHSKDSLKIAKQNGDRVTEGRANKSLGDIFCSSHMLDEAVKHYKECLKIASELDDKKSEGLAYVSLGWCKLEVGDYNDALELFDNQIRLAEKIKDNELEDVGYFGKGAVYEALRNYEQALNCHQKCLEVAKATGDKGRISLSFISLGRLYGNMAVNFKEEKGEHEKKQQCLAQSIYLLRKGLPWHEWQFKYLQEQDHFKISFLETLIEDYNLLTLMLLDSEDHKEALLASERGRARALNDLLISKYNLNRSQLRSDPITYDEIENMSSNFSIIYFAIPQVQITCTWIMGQGRSPMLVQSAVKDGLSDIVTSAYNTLNVRNVQCEDRSIQTDKQNLPVSQMKSNGFEDVSEELLLSACEMFKKRNILKEDLEDYDSPSTLQGLYKSLISPVLDQVTKDEIVIIPDGALFKVPFAALRHPDTGDFLSETKRIRLAPSLTSLKALQESPADFHSKTGALIIGNPKVGKVMFRGQTRVISDLPCAEREAKLIGELLGIKPFIGSQAMKEVIKQNLREGVAIIHFAAHGTTDGEIFLAPSTTGDLPNEEDYILTMKDVQESGVRPQLVVLSCCHSGRGEIKAEGVVGMSRAFLASGARAVVASLWAIADDATMVFMEKFYTHLKQGESASRSLQQAMKDMRELPGYNDPQFWAPFFIIGDDVTITMWDK